MGGQVFLTKNRVHVFGRFGWIREKKVNMKICKNEKKKKVNSQTFFAILLFFFVCIKKMKRRVGQNPRWLIYYQYYQLKINSKKHDYDFL